jgi:hypothetical protein
MNIDNTIKNTEEPKEEEEELEKVLEKNEEPNENENENNIIVIDENTGEDMLMECGDEELEPLESSAEFIDYDNPIQYTNEQMSFNLLNLISFNDKDVLKNKSFWNKRAREFVETFKIYMTEPSLNPKLLPIIIANKIFVLDDDNINDPEEDDEDRDSDLSNLFIIETTMKNILENRTILSKSKEPFLTNFPTAIKLERIWTTDKLITKEFSIPTLIKNDTFAYLYTRDDSIRRIHLFGKIDNMNYYEGDNVNLAGYVYMINPDFDTIMFNPNTYLQELKEMNIGDKVKLYFNYDKDLKQGVIKNIVGDTLTITINSKNEDIEISKKNIHKNDYFVYTYNSTNVFYKYMLKNKNVTFLLLEGETDPDSTIQMMILNAAEVLYLWRPESKNMYSIMDFYKRLYQYGLVSNDINEKAFLSLKDLVEDNTLKIIQNTPNKNPVKKKYTKIFKVNHDLLDLKKHSQKLSSYSPYIYYNHLSDTEYNRSKYITGQGDNGMIYYTQIIQDYCDILFNDIDKNKTVYDKELTDLNKQLTELESKYKHIDCSTFEPEVKKTYTDINDLEMDNFKHLPNVNDGDYAKLTIYTDKDSNNKYINPIHVFYRRVILKDDKDEKEFWVKDKEMTYNLCADDNKLGDHSSLTKQKCIYDDKEKLCKVKELYLIKNTIEHLKIRKNILKKLQDFYKNYGKVKLDQQKNLEWLKQMLGLSIKKSLFELSYETDTDYTDFVGDADAEDEDKYGSGEVGEGIKYTILKTTKDDEEDYRKPRLENENFAELLIKQFGITITDFELQYIIDNHNYYTGEEQKALNNLIQSERNKYTKMAKDGLIKYKKEHPNDDDAKLKRVANDFKNKKDDFIKKKENLYYDDFYKKSIFYICALFIIVVQLKLPDVSLVSGFTNCMKDFGLEGFPINQNNKSLLKYVSCVLKQISSPNDERLSSIHKTALEQVHAGIIKIITKILKEKIDENEKLKQIAMLLTDDKTKEKSTATYTEWPSYRPVSDITGNPTDAASLNLVKYFRLMYELSKQSSLTEKLNKDTTLMTSYLTNNTFKELFKTLSIKKKETYLKPKFDKSIRVINEDEELFNQKDITLNHIKIYHIKPTPRIEYEILDKDLKESIVNIDDNNYWNIFPDTIAEYVQIYLSKYTFDEKLKTDIVEIMFDSDDTNALLFRNSLRNFIFDDLKTIMSKIVNLWKADFTWLRELPQLDKKRKEHAMVLDILSISDKISEINSRIELDKDIHKKLQDKISKIISTLMYSYEPYDIKNLDTKYLKRNIFIYEYLFMYILHSIVNAIYPNPTKSDDIFNIIYIEPINTINDIVLQNKLKIAFDIGQYMLETFVDKMKTNTFNAIDITRKHEELREVRKQDIINRLDKLNTDDRKIILDLQKRNLMKWTDVPLEGEIETTGEILGDLKITTETADKKLEEENMFDKLNEAEEDENDKILYTGRDGDGDFDDDDNMEDEDNIRNEEV